MASRFAAPIRTLIFGLAGFCRTPIISHMKAILWLVTIALLAACRPTPTPTPTPVNPSGVYTFESPKRTASYDLRSDGRLLYDARDQLSVGVMSSRGVGTWVWKDGSIVVDCTSYAEALNTGLPLGSQTKFTNTIHSEFTLESNGDLIAPDLTRFIKRK